VRLCHSCCASQWRHSHCFTRRVSPPTQVSSSNHSPITPAFSTRVNTRRHGACATDRASAPVVAVAAAAVHSRRQVRVYGRKVVLPQRPVHRWSLRVRPSLDWRPLPDAAPHCGQQVVRVRAHAEWRVGYHAGIVSGWEGGRPSPLSTSASKVADVTLVSLHCLFMLQVTPHTTPGLNVQVTEVSGWHLASASKSLRAVKLILESLTQVPCDQQRQSGPEHFQLGRCCPLRRPIRAVVSYCRPVSAASRPLEGKANTVHSHACSFIAMRQWVVVPTLVACGVEWSGPSTVTAVAPFPTECRVFAMYAITSPSPCPPTSILPHASPCPSTHRRLSLVPFLLTRH